MNKKITPAIIASIFFIIAGFGLSFISKFLFYSQMDFDYWFYYESVVPTEDEFMVGEELKFKSTAAVFRDAHMVWNDILRCKTSSDEEFSFYSNFKSENLNAEGRGPDAEMINREWFFQGRVPNRLSICYLVSVIQVELPLGLKKTQEITGPEFIITPYKDEITLSN